MTGLAKDPGPSGSASVTADNKEPEKAYPVLRPVKSVTCVTFPPVYVKVAVRPVSSVMDTNSSATPSLSWSAYE